MTCVVRHKTTGDYLEARDRWTSHLDRALHFNSGLKLVFYLEQAGRKNSADALEIVPVTPEDRPVSHSARV